MFGFNWKYSCWTIILFGIEVFIAFFISDRIIRPHIGDLLVVILIYCFVRSFLNISVWTAAIGVLFFSYMVEVFQYFNVVKLLGMDHSPVARIIIGTTFNWLDILAYTLGILIVLFIENRWHLAFKKKAV